MHIGAENERKYYILWLSEYLNRINCAYLMVFILVIA